MNYEKNNKKGKEEKNTIIRGILQRKIKPVLVLTIIFILLFSSSSTLLASVVDDLIISIKDANSTEELEQVTAQVESLESNIEEAGNEVNQTENEIIQDQSEEREIQYTEEYLKWLNSSDEEKKVYGNVIPRKEFVPFNEDKEPYKEQSSEVKTDEGQNNNNEFSNTTIVRNNKKTVVLSESSSLPSRYRLNEHYDITVEDQEQSGWCGAFSSLKSLETHLQVKGYYNPINKSNTKIKEDFSEWHMAFKAPATGGALTTGGSFWSFYHYCGIDSTYGDVSKIEKARGPVLEDNITESVANIIKRGGSNIPEEYLIYTNSLIPAYKVTKVKIFSSIYKKYNNGNVKYYSWDDQEIDNNNITEFRNDIKNHIVNYGGVYAVMGVGEDFSGYNSETNAVYTSDERWTHAVTIVGWDDNYSRYNFNEENRPKNNGAYIALNSYGTGDGDNGYLYISYDDVNIEQDLNGVLEVQRYDQIPDYKITQKRKDGKIEVSITSSQRLRFRGTPDANGYYSNEWKATAEAYEDVRFGAVLKAETVLKKAFNKTTTEEITFYDDFLKNKQTVTISVIDPMPPKINSITQSKELNGMLKFTVNASDDDSGIAGYSFDDGETWTVSNYKYIDSSENEVKIKVKDNAGNISSYNIKIRNSDNKPPELDKTFGNNGISYTLLAGNKNVKVTVKANEALKTIEDVSLGEEWIIDSADNTKAYVTVDRNKQGKIKLVDLAGNKSEEIHINVNQIITSIGAKKTYKANGQTLTEGAKTAGPVNVEIVVDMPVNLMKDSKGDNEKKLWTIDYTNDGETHLSKTYSDSSNGIFEEILTVQDKTNVNNKRTITIKVNIDKEKPIIQEVQSRIIEDDKVTIKLNASEKVTIKESQGNWKLSEQDGKTILTKEFTENTQGEGEKIIVKDQVGNESEPYYVKVDSFVDFNVSEPEYNEIKTSNGKNAKRVKIYANKKPKEISATDNSTWKIATNTNSNKEIYPYYIYRDYTQNGQATVTLKDSRNTSISKNLKVEGIDNEVPILDTNFGANGILYSLSKNGKSVTVAIKATEELKEIEDVDFGEQWQIYDNGEDTDKVKKVAYVTIDENKQGKIKLVDLAGNKSEEIQINVDQIITEIGATKEYKILNEQTSEIIGTITQGKKTQGPVKAEIVVNMPVDLVEDSKGDNEKNLWTIDYANNEKTHLSKTYTDSTNGVFEEILTVQDKTNSNNKRTITVKVNIDKEKPVIQEVQDRIIEDNKVTVVLNASEKVTIKESQGNWILSEQDGKTILTKEFTENTQGEGEKIIVKDQVGNESEPFCVKVESFVDFNVSNPEYNNTKTSDGQNAKKVKIYVNKKPKEIIATDNSTWKTATNNGNNKETYPYYIYATYIQDVEATITLKDERGISISKDIEVKGIDNTVPQLDVSFGTEGILYTLSEDGKSVTAVVKATEELKEIEDVDLGEQWQIYNNDKKVAYVTVDENKKGRIKLVDLAGNKSEEILINAELIAIEIRAVKGYKLVNEQTSETIGTITQGKRTKGPVKAEVIVRMPVNLIGDTMGDTEKGKWIVEEINGETHLSKTYTDSTNGVFEEILTVQDKTNENNIRTITLKVNIDKEKPVIQETQNRIVEGNKVTVKLNVSEKVTIKESDGNWILSQDGTVLTKTFEQNTEENGEKLVVIDQVGNESEPYYVKINNLGNDEEDDSNDPIVDPTDDEPILGDINLSGNIDGDDLLLLKKYLLLGKQEKIDWFEKIEQSKNADIDGNGNIGITDLLILKRKLDNSDKNN